MNTRLLVKVIIGLVLIGLVGIPACGKREVERQKEETIGGLDWAEGITLKDITMGVGYNESLIKDWQAQVVIEYRRLKEEKPFMHWETSWAQKGRKLYFDRRKFKSKGTEGWKEWIRVKGTFDGEKSRIWSSANNKGSIHASRHGSLDSSWTFPSKLGLELHDYSKRYLSKLITEGRVKLREKTQEVDGHHCYVLDVKVAGEGIEYEIFMDVKRGFRPIRIIEYALGWNLKRKGILRVVDDIQLEQFGDVWVPVSGVVKAYSWDSGESTYAQDITITTKKVKVNSGIVDDLFVLKFEDGTEVWNDLTKTWYRAGEVDLEPVPDNIVKEVTAGQMLGKRAPDFTLDKMDGGEFTLSGEKDKVVVLYFWATWCGTCIRALPRLQKVYEWGKKNQRPVVIYCIDIGEGPKRITRLWERKGFSMPVLLDRTGRVAKLYGVMGLPKTVIIADGKIQHTSVGGSEGRVKELLTDLLSRSPNR